MRINRINNNYNANFGFNFDLHTNVSSALSSSKDECDAYINSVNQFVNTLETRLRYEEMLDTNPKTANNFASLLLQLKPAVAKVIDNLHPEFKYSEKEIEAYTDELRKKDLQNGDTWLNKLTASLKNNNSGKNLRIRGQLSRSNEDSDKETKVNKLVERFTPSEYSPKGLNDLGGMDEIKEMLRDKVIYPAENPKMAFLDEIEYGKKTPRGELLYGPPGCGKTSVIEAIATETGFPLYKLKIGKAGSKYVNETSSNVQKAFDYVASIAQMCDTPVFLAIDEMESMTSQRRGGGSGEDDKLVSTLLQIIEEARSKNVIILGATNCFNLIDDAIKSRFEDKIYVGLPDDETRRQVLKIQLKKRTKGETLASIDKELDKVVRMTAGFSNRDIAILTDKAALIARKDGRREIEARDFEIPVKENLNMKVKESLYQDKASRPMIGFGN